MHYIVLTSDIFCNIGKRQSKNVGEMTHRDEVTKAFYYYEILKQAVYENDHKKLEKAEKMADDIDFTKVTKGILDKIDKLYNHENYRV